MDARTHVKMSSTAAPTTKTNSMRLTQDNKIRRIAKL